MTSRPGPRHVLQAGGDVGGLTDEIGDFTPAAEGGVRDERQPGVDGHADLDGRRYRGGLHAGRADRFDQGEPRVHGTCRIVLVRLRKAPAGHEPVAEGVVQPTPVVLHSARRGRLIPPEQFPQLLRVELSRQGGRPHEVAEQHGDLAAGLFARAARLLLARRRAAAGTAPRGDHQLPLS